MRWKSEIKIVLFGGITGYGGHLLLLWLRSLLHQVFILISTILFWFQMDALDYKTLLRR